jgi:DnaK suppressor protein
MARDLLPESNAFSHPTTRPKKGKDMNSQHTAKNWKQRNGKAKEKWQRPIDGRLLVNRLRGRAQPGQAIGNQPAPSVSRAAVGVKPESGPQPRRMEDQRRALLALRARLRGDVIGEAERTLSDGTETATSLLDPVDCANEIVKQDLAVGLLGSAAMTLKQIDAALARMGEGSYGRCLECGARIPRERLEAVPYATCCVQCAARQEQVI